MRNDDYDIEAVYIPGLPAPKYRVKAERASGPEFKTRAEAEKRRAELLREA